MLNNKEDHVVKKKKKTVIEATAGMIVSQLRDDVNFLQSHFLLGSGLASLLADSTEDFMFMSIYYMTHLSEEFPKHIKTFW